MYSSCPFYCLQASTHYTNKIYLWWRCHTTMSQHFSSRFTKLVSWLSDSNNMEHCEAWYMLDSAALFGSSKWPRICVSYYMLDVAVAVFRFYKPACYSWIHNLLKSEATSYSSNSVLYKNVLSLTEILVLFQQKLLKCWSGLENAEWTTTLVKDVQSF